MYHKLKNRDAEKLGGGDCRIIRITRAPFLSGELPCIGIAEKNLRNLTFIVIVGFFFKKDGIISSHIYTKTIFGYGEPGYSVSPFKKVMKFYFHPAEANPEGERFGNHG